MRSRKHNLPADLDAPRRSRRLIEQWMAGHPRLPDAVLALSEIVANAVIHGAPGSIDGGITLHFETDGPTRHIAVSHRGGPFDPTSDRPIHGLGLVEQTVDRWGIDADNGSVEVWFEMDAEDDDHADAGTSTDMTGL